MGKDPEAQVAAKESAKAATLLHRDSVRMGETLRGDGEKQGYALAVSLVSHTSGLDVTRRCGVECGIAFARLGPAQQSDRPLTTLNGSLRSHDLRREGRGRARNGPK
jgi:hypothetical protein